MDELWQTWSGLGGVANRTASVRKQNPQERILRSDPRLTAGIIPEGVAFGAATASLSLFAGGIPQERNPALGSPPAAGADP